MPPSSLRHLLQRLQGRSRRGARLYIVEFDLAELSSHFFNQALGFKRAAEERGMLPRVLLRTDVAAGLAEQLAADRVIAFAPASVERLAYRLDAFADDDRQLQSLWNAIAGMGVSRRDIVLITTTLAAVVYSVGAWLGRLDPERRPAVFFRCFDHDYLDPATMAYNERSWMYRFAARDMALRPGQDRVFLTANNPALAVRLEALCGRRIFEMPLPKYYGEVRDCAGADAGPPVIYVHVNKRAAALLDRIDALLRAILHARPDAKLLVKYCLNAIKPGTSARLSPDLLARGAELLPSEQPTADYLQTIARSHLVLLPYDPIAYRGLASGVFAEGAALGKVLIYPFGSWMAREVAEGRAAGIGFAVADEAEVVAAVLQALDGLPQLLPQARAGAAAFRQQHSCARNLDLMLALAGSPHSMRPACVPGSAVRFDGSLHSRVFLGRGWSQTEPGGVWTDGPVAELSLRLEPRPAGALELRMHLTPFFADNGKQQVAVAINGVPLCDWRFAAPEERYPASRHVTIPARLLARDTIDLVLRIENPVSPLRLGVSSDLRCLGVMLHEMMLAPATEAAPSRANRRGAGATLPTSS